MSFHGRSEVASLRFSSSRKFSVCTGREAGPVVRDGRHGDARRRTVDEFGGESGSRGTRFARQELSMSMFTSVGSGRCRVLRTCHLMLVSGPVLGKLLENRDFLSDSAIGRTRSGSDSGNGDARRRNDDE